MKKKKLNEKLKLKKVSVANLHKVTGGQRFASGIANTGPRTELSLCFICEG